MDFEFELHTYITVNQRQHGYWFGKSRCLGNPGLASTDQEQI